MTSTLSITSRLPQEIVDTIVDGCSLSRNLKILRNCALVCRAFLPRSQRHIFLGIRISCAIQRGKMLTGGRRLDELYNILQRSPHIAGYVRDIRLVVKDNRSWVVGNPKFEWIMDLLTRNAVFKRFHFDGHLTSDKFGVITPSHLQSFEKSFSQRYIVPFITSLKLYRVKNVPISLLVGSSRLKKLTLIRTTLGDIEMWNHRLDNTTLPKLHELYFHHCSETVTSLLGNPQTGSPPLLDLSSLYSLAVNQDSSADIQCAMRIIKLTARSLKHINFIHHNSNVYIPVTGLLNLENAPKLRTLRLDTVCGDRRALDDLNSVLSTVRPKHRIGKVRITMHMSDRTRSSPGDALDAGCIAVDAAITKLYQGKPMSFELHFSFPQRPSLRILLSKRKRALGKIGDMSTSEFSQLILTKCPLAAMLPGVTVTLAHQKDRMPKEAFRGMKSFLRRIRELIIE